MKVGIIGIAHMHVESYSACFKKLDVEIVGVYDRNEERLFDFCKRNNLKSVTDIDELARADIDTVLICSENALHCEYTILAAQQGKNVIVEKPMALTVEEANKMIIACQEANVKLMIAHPVRFSKTMQTLKRQVLEKKIGTVLGINATNHGKNPGGWFVEQALSGGGAIIDHTIHMADLAYWLFQPEIESVYAMDANWTPNCQVEDNGLLHIRFKNGLFMSLDTSWNRPNNYPAWGDASLTLITDRGYLHTDGFGRKAITYTDDQTVFSYYDEDMDLCMIKAFKEAIDNNLPSPVSGEAGKFTVKLAQLAYESIREQNIINA